MAQTMKAGKREYTYEEGVAGRVQRSQRWIDVTSQSGEEAFRMAEHILGYGYAWWHGDALSPLPPLPGFTVAPTDDAAFMARLSRLDEAQLQARMHDAHTPYVAWLDEHPVAYGWSAMREGAVDELGLRFAIPDGNRYLWDFVTLPEWRGQGIYPRFLQAVLIHECATASRFWIAHAVDNTVSQRGIIKAGFQLVEALSTTANRKLCIQPMGLGDRAPVSPMGLRLGLCQNDER